MTRLPVSPCVTLRGLAYNKTLACWASLTLFYLNFHMNPGSTTISPSTRHSILLLSFATFSSMAAQRICDAMLPELSRVFSVSLAQAAQVISVFAVVYGLAQIFYGPLGDRLGKFKIITFATLACSVGSVVAVFHPV